MSIPLPVLHWADIVMLLQLEDLEEPLSKLQRIPPSGGEAYNFNELVDSMALHQNAYLCQYSISRAEFFK